MDAPPDGRRLAQGLAPWTLAGLAVMLLSGPLLFSSDPDMYYLNRSFQIKMVCLLLAIVFHYTIHRKTVVAGAAPSTLRAGLVACVAGALGGRYRRRLSLEA